MRKQRHKQMMAAYCRYVEARRNRACVFHGPLTLRTENNVMTLGDDTGWVIKIG
jgi:hypothetical protein